MKKKFVMQQRKKMNPALAAMTQQRKEDMLISAAAKANLLIALMVLHDKFDYGEKRLQRFLGEYYKQLEAYNTVHVETVCLLYKLNAKQHIEVEVKLDELDLTAAESKATYEEIKAYVLEHSAMKVSSLYIAQVKQKCGIIERENYNKPKSEDAKQPQCPPEKEKAIMEALKHFGMV